jgi:disulfide bond formation protein DsbB
MRLIIRERQVLIAAAAAALAAFGGALVSQHVFDMMPCAWCVFQRLLYCLIAAFALAGAFTSGTARRVSVSLAFVTAGIGIASALFQQLHAVNQLSCDRSLAEKVIAGLHLDSLFPNVFMAFASCADAAVNLLGVPYAVWSCTMFTLLAVLLLWTLRFELRRAR